MRLLLLVLIALVGLIQYPLWMGRGGWLAVWDMQSQVAAQRSINDGLRARNVALEAEVEDLRSGTEASEERARAELGMMRQGEVFVQVLPPDVKAPELKPSSKTHKPGSLLVPLPAVVPNKVAVPTTKPASAATRPGPPLLKQPKLAPKPVTPATTSAPSTTKPTPPVVKPTSAATPAN